MLALAPERSLNSGFHSMSDSTAPVGIWAKLTTAGRCIIPNLGNRMSAR